MKGKSVFQGLRSASYVAIIFAIPFLGAGCAYDPYANPIRHDYDYCDVEGYRSQTSGDHWYGQSRYGGYQGGYGGGYYEGDGCDTW
jgi:hypothetical protein